MANIKSQKKRNRQNEVARARNKAVRSELKTRARNAITAAESGDAAAIGQQQGAIGGVTQHEPHLQGLASPYVRRRIAEEALRTAQRRIDKAAQKGIINESAAARSKSRLTKQVHSRLG